MQTINSKVLLVGGLTKCDHLTQMIDMALQLRETFESNIIYDVKKGNSQSKASVQINVGFGIHVGRLLFF